jgi:outer membrane protein OmpA-like peptidoglycan-associated protein
MATDHAKRTHPTMSLVFGLAGTVFASGCASGNETAPPPELPDAGADGSYQTELPQPPEPEQRTLELELVADLKRCDVDNPNFFYDETTVRPQAVPELKRLAACLTTAPFADVDLLLVGHADPRGSNEYNEDLARERAQQVRNMLIDYGVPSRRMEIATRGESEAMGDTPHASFGYDRRVDVVQLQVIHP